MKRAISLALKGKRDEMKLMCREKTRAIYSESTYTNARQWNVAFLVERLQPSQTRGRKRRAVVIECAGGGMSSQDALSDFAFGLAASAPILCTRGN